MSEIHSPAEAASQRALESMYACLSVASKLPASPLLTWRRMKSSREQIEAPSFFVIPIMRSVGR